MDVSIETFSAPEYDPLAFVNSVLNSASDARASAAAQDAHISTALVRLQLLVDECTEKIDTQMTKTVAVLPRVRREAKTIASAMPSVTSAMSSILASYQSTVTLEQVQQERAGGGAGAVHAVDSSTHFMHQLQLLDNVKSRLERTRGLLGRAADWDRLQREIDVLGEAATLQTPAGITRIADHLAAMERAEAALQSLPNADSRAAAVAGVRALLLSSVQPLVQQALDDDDSAAVRAAFAVFHALQRPSEFTSLLVQLRVQPLVSAMRSFVAAQSGARHSEGASSGHSSATGASPVAVALARELSSMVVLEDWLRVYHAGIVRLVTAEAHLFLRLFEPIHAPAAAPAADEDSSSAEAVGDGSSQQVPQADAAAARTEAALLAADACVALFSSCMGEAEAGGLVCVGLRQLLLRLEAEPALLVEMYQSAAQAGGSALTIIREVAMRGMSTEVTLPRRLLMRLAAAAGSPYTALFQRLHIMEREQLGEACHQHKLPLPAALPAPFAAPASVLLAITSASGGTVVLLPPDAATTATFAAAVAGLTNSKQCLRAFIPSAFSALTRGEVSTLLATAPALLSACDTAVLELQQRVYAALLAAHDAAFLPLLTPSTTASKPAFSATTVAAVSATSGGGSSGGVSRRVPTGDSWLDESPSPTVAVGKPGSITRRDASGTSAGSAGVSGAPVASVALPALGDLHTAVLLALSVCADLTLSCTLLSSTAAQLVRLWCPVHEKLLGQHTQDVDGTAGDDNDEEESLSGEEELQRLHVASCLADDGGAAAALAQQVQEVRAPHSPRATTYLQRATAATESLAAEVHRRAFELHVAHLAALLAGVRTLPCWTEGASREEEEEDASVEYSVPPSRYIVSVTEHLLAVAQLMAPSKHPLVQAAHAAAAAAATHGGGGGGGAEHAHAHAHSPVSAAATAVVVPTVHVMPPAVVHAGNTRLHVPPLRAVLAAHASAALRHCSGLGHAEMAAAYEYASVPLPQTASTSSASASGAADAAADSDAAIEHTLSVLRGVEGSWSASDAHQWLSRHVVQQAQAQAQAQAQGHAEQAQHQAQHGSEVERATELVTGLAMLWLRGLARVICALLVLELLRVPHMRPAGGKQARADLDYLSTVLSAVGMSPEPLLSRTVELLTLPSRDVLLLARKEGGEAALLRHIARMRGLV